MTAVVKSRADAVPPGVGFYGFQAGRPIFQTELAERTLN